MPQALLINKLLKIEEMFYSPKKDIDRYVSLKNHEIRSLREEIQKDKLTQENVELAKKKLDKLKNQYNILVSENHNELIQTLRKAEERRKALQQQIQLKEKNLFLKIQEESQVGDMKVELVAKLEQAKHRLKTLKDKQGELSTQQNQVDSEVLSTVKQNEAKRQENLEVKNLNRLAAAESSLKSQECSAMEEKCQQLKKMTECLSGKVVSLKDQIRDQKVMMQMQELKMESHQMKLEALKETKNTMQSKKQNLLLKKLMQKERSQLNKLQSQSSEAMSKLHKVAQNMKHCKEQQLESCEREVKEGLIEVEVSECLNNELNSGLERVKQKINNTEKGLSQIQEGLDKGVTKDTELISMIMGRDAANLQSPLRKLDLNKQSAVSGWRAKVDLLDLQKTASEDTADVVA